MRPSNFNVNLLFWYLPLTPNPGKICELPGDSKRQGDVFFHKIILQTPSGGRGTIVWFFKPIPNHAPNLKHWHNFVKLQSRIFLICQAKLWEGIAWERKKRKMNIVCLFVRIRPHKEGNNPLIFCNSSTWNEEIYTKIKKTGESTASILSPTKSRPTASMMMKYVMNLIFFFSCLQWVSFFLMFYLLIQDII